MGDVREIREAFHKAWGADRGEGERRPDYDKAAWMYVSAKLDAFLAQPAVGGEGTEAQKGAIEFLLAERDTLRAEVSRLRGEVAALRDAFAPVNDWYQSDEQPERPLADKVRDAVADLQADRATALNAEQRERAAYRWSALTVRNRRGILNGVRQGSERDFLDYYDKLEADIAAGPAQPAPETGEG